MGSFEMALADISTTSAPVAEERISVKVMAAALIAQCRVGAKHRPKAPRNWTTSRPTKITMKAVPKAPMQESDAPHAWSAA